MTENINITVKAHKKNVATLPKVGTASIHVAGNKGKVKDGKLSASAFIITVKIAEDWTDCNGVMHYAGEWRPENEWLHLSGMKTARRVYTDIEKARAAKESIKTEWGKAVAKKEKKGRGQTKAELEDEVATLKRLIEEMKKAA